MKKSKFVFTKDTCIDATKKAVTKLGGPTKAAAQLSLHAKETIPVNRVIKWCAEGVARDYALLLSWLGKEPIQRLHPKPHLLQIPTRSG